MASLTIQALLSERSSARLRKEGRERIRMAAS
jgi:hypothetical protein